MSRTVIYALVAGLAVLAAYIVPPLQRQLKVLGLGRSISSTILNANDYIKIPDTTHCEDLHHYLPADLLFTACEDSHTKFSWFPPLLNFDPPAVGSQGSFKVIDPKTFKTTKLAFENFDSTFSTHGIDVIPDPEAKDAVFIFAVNHQPNPEWTKTRAEGVHKSNSQVELFHYKLGSETIKHIRTVRHPLIETPNDIYATSPTTFYVTNDHRYREGVWRTWEVLLPTAGWSNVAHVSIADLSSTSPTEGVDVSIALTGLKNNNGLGHVYRNGKDSEEIMVASAESGIFYLAHAGKDLRLNITDTISIDSAIDNPTYFSDPYATSGNDASGYVLAGLARGIDIPENAKNPNGIDPTYVWLVRRKEASAPGTEEWEKRLVFSDDSSRLRTASAAVIVAIDPAKEGGKKKGWLFATGFMSENMIATKIEL